MLIALALLVLDGGEGEAEAIPPATVTTSAPSTSTPPSTSTSTAPPTSTTLDPEARKAQVERILEDLELARLVAIYERNTAALGDIVATQRGYELAVGAMDNLVFEANPSVAGVKVTVLEVLLDRPDCLVIFHEFDGRSSLGEGAVEEGVRILWPRETGSQNYRLARLWSSPGDLWQDDCDLVDRTELP